MRENNNNVRVKIYKFVNIIALQYVNKLSCKYWKSGKQ